LRILGEEEGFMEWARLLAYITGTVDQQLLLRNEYLAAENRILKAQIRGRLCLSNADRATLGEIGHRLGRRALGEVANAALPDTILGRIDGWSPASSMVANHVEALADPVSIGGSSSSLCAWPKRIPLGAMIASSGR
jgi:hypothetical protein